ncbi:MAG: hypothetical protein R3298_00470 [Gammaproteobacteria bacterium]|nr:hypothetical protein [Gammaproteobacteria bacterium]
MRRCDTKGSPMMRLGRLSSVAAWFARPARLDDDPKPVGTAKLLFVGHFHAKPVAERDGQVEVLFSLRLFNYSGEDVADGTLSIMDLIPPRTVYGRFPSLTLADGHELFLAGQLSAPAQDIGRSGDGIAPLATLDYTGSDGASRRELIEMIPAQLIAAMER